jgi:hypothetical protein
MSVYKEGWNAVQTIGGRSARVYPDACDYGALFRQGDDTWVQAKTAAHFYGIKETRKVETYLTGKTATIEFELMDEFGRTPAKVTRFRMEVVRPEKPIKVRAGQFDGYIYIEELH